MKMQGKQRIKGWENSPRYAAKSLRELLMLLFLASALLNMHGCGSSTYTSDKSTVTINLGGSPSGSISASSIPTYVDSVKFTISAEDMGSIKKVVSTGGETAISESFDVPNGDNRHFLVEAMNTLGNVLYKGEKYSDVPTPTGTINIVMESTDPNSPSVPAGLTVNVVSSDLIDLSWNESTDDTGVAGYNIYRDGVYLKSSVTNSTSDTGLWPSTDYCYSVSAFDGIGNESARSGEVCAKTQSLLTVWAWGDNYYGQVGDGTITDRNTYVEAIGLANVVSVAAGRDHSLAIKPDRTIEAWGYNGFGQLGDGSDVEYSTTPVETVGLGNIAAIAGGGDHSLAIGSDGTVWAWGSNHKGQLGIGNTTNSGVPVKVSNLTDITAITAGRDHSLALKSSGTVWAWGSNHKGQLGIGNTTDSHVPVQVDNSGFANAVAIAAGAFHSLAIGSDGTVWAWGYNGDGRLGDGTNVDSHVPVQVDNSGLANAVAIAAGLNHSLAINSDGTVWAWGDNYWGQLGDDSSSDSSIPVKTIGLANVITIAGGDYHSLALKSDRSVWAWGANYYGQLGIGNTTSSNVPVAVSGLTDGVDIKGGGTHSLTVVSIDTVPPSVPAGLIANVVSSDRIDLLWQEASDDIRLAGYKIYRDAAFVNSVSAADTSYSDTGLDAGTYCYRVSAYDIRGNESDKSSQACETTP